MTRHLLLALLACIAVDTFAESRADATLRAIAKYSDWIATGRIAAISASDCKLSEAPHEPLVDVTFDVTEAWKGSVPPQVRFRLIERQLPRPLRIGDSAVVFFETIRVSCAETTRATGILPIDGSYVMSEAVAGEPALQSVEGLRNKVHVILGGAN
jgi:hypothetical protein